MDSLFTLRAGASRLPPAFLFALLLLAGCRRHVVAPQPVRARASQPQRSLRLDLPEPDRARIIVSYYQKPVMGRRASMRDVERIVMDIAPILERAARQPEVVAPLERIAEDDGTTVEAARERWVRLQEADILLESGGDPEDVSSANAVGVAQWIYETGRRAGLKVDLPQSNALTAQIDPLKRDVAWLEYLAAPGPKTNLPGSPRISLTEAAARLPGENARLEQLRAQRRMVDERYDPEKALFAHTRYLLGLYRRFPDLQWVFQAFHGGEAGVARTLAKYMGPGWKGTPADAIRAGNRGRRLTYEHVYFTSGPTSHAAAFSYLYGRGDDHRHYWWKLRAAEEAFALNRRDPAAFRRTWESLLPGRAKEAMWYPQGPDEAFTTPADVEGGVRAGALVGVAASPNVALRPVSRGTDALRPESAGLLRLLGTEYHRAGGKDPLVIGDMSVSSERIRKLANGHVASPWPPNPLLTALPGGGPPGDFNYHATGWAFDIPRPSDDAKRKTLEYAIGWLRDHDVLWFMEETDGGPRRYHIVPNPGFRDSLAAIARNGAVSIPTGSLRAPVRSAAGRNRRPER